MSHHDAAAQAADTYRAEMERAASNERMAREARREAREAYREARERGREKAGEGHSTSRPPQTGQDTGATHTLAV